MIGVPAHDTRDADFASVHKLPMKTVIWPTDNADKKDGCTFCGPLLSYCLPLGVCCPQKLFAYCTYDNLALFCEYGVVVNCPGYDGLSSAEMIKRIVAEAKAKGVGHARASS